MKTAVSIKNKRARFDYELIETYTVGIVLAGTEIKSIRASKARITDSFCEFNDNGELFIINMHIDPYANGGYVNHLPKASRKLLLQKRELRKLEKEVSQKGMAIVPLSLFINQSGRAKIEIALAKGKKNYDKRETLKERENKRDLDRVKKQHNTKWLAFNTFGAIEEWYKLKISVNRFVKLFTPFSFDNSHFLLLFSDRNNEDSANF